MILILSFLFSDCGFPYHTQQAKDYRKHKRQSSTKTTEIAKTITSDDTLGKVLFDADIKPVLNDTGSIPAIDSLYPDEDDLLNLQQPDSSIADSNTTTKLDSIKNAIQAKSSRLLDSTKLDSFPETMTVRYSVDSITLPVQYECTDSMIYDISKRKVYLFNNAEVFYEQYNLKAGYIEFDFKTNIATATCLIDSLGNEIQCPEFDDKNQQFTCRRMEFNFKTKKGKVYDASTKQGDGFLVSDATKFFNADQDSSENKNNILYSKGCLYTTCDHKHPHFGIRASKAKIIPGKLIVVGPSFLEIMGSPTPIILPFGFFPITKNKKSGLILSTDIDFSPTLGPGLREIGFFIHLNDYVDLKVTGDFYIRGSLRARLNSNYNIKYKGNGSVRLGYTRLQFDEIGTPQYDLQQSFNFSWNHAQASQAHPSQRFNANVNFGTSDYYKNTFNDANSVLQATINSNIAYTKTFTGTPFSLAVRLSHSQNTQNKTMTINFPVINFNMNQIFPFKRKKISGTQKWYERIGFSYSMNAKNTINTTDTALFKPGGLEEAIANMNYGITHSPRLNFSFKLFKFINVQPTVNYSQQWFFYRNRKFLDPTPVLDPGNPTDTLDYGTVTDYREYGFFSTHKFSASVNMNTQIFATGIFNIGALKQMRAVITPSVGFSWQPDYENAYDYFYDSVQTDTRYPDQLIRYNYFSFTPPSGKTSMINYSLATLIEAKIKKGKRDTLSDEPFKKVVLIPSATLNGNVNLAADSLQLSPINFNVYTTLFKKINLRYSATFDPYTADPESNRRLNRFEFNTSGKIVRVTSMAFNANTSLSASDFKKIFKNNATTNQDQKTFDLIKNINIRYDLIINNRFVEGIDSTVITANQLSFSGTINLSKGWNIRVGNIGFSFKDERVTYPDFTFSRDLHCWQMGLSWQPERQSWSFFIRAKPGSLSFLDVPVKREFYDVF